MNLFVFLVFPIGPFLLWILIKVNKIKCNRSVKHPICQLCSFVLNFILLFLPVMDEGGRKLPPRYYRSFLGVKMSFAPLEN